MSEAGFSHKISGADKFQLLLDRHIRFTEPTGNIISLSIEVKGKIDAEELHKTVSTNTFLTQINSLEIEDGFLKIPRWKNGLVQTPVIITVSGETYDEPYIEEQGSTNLLNIDLVQGETNSVVSISVQHAVADNRGIQAIAQIITGNIPATGSLFAEEEKDTISFIQQLVHTLKATRLVFRKTPKKLAKLIETNTDADINSVTKRYSILNFTSEETLKIEENANHKGARLSKSAFYLAATSMALQQTIFAGNEGNTFFLPVPQNQRPRGNDQVTLGNNLSFLFYTILFSKLNDLSESTAFITEQMKQQIKEQSTKSYAYLLKTFRILPLAVYDLFFKMPTKGAVCSFLFSDVGETLADMKTFMGKEIVEVLNFPPNPCPPHITFVVMKHAGSLKVITAYNPKAVSRDEISKFEETLSALLKP